MRTATARNVLGGVCLCAAGLVAGFPASCPGLLGGGEPGSDDDDDLGAAVRLAWRALQMGGGRFAPWLDLRRRYEAAHSGCSF
jgi:hypothetical protein